MVSTEKWIIKNKLIFNAEFLFEHFIFILDARDLHLYYRVFANKSEQPFQSE